MTVVSWDGVSEYHEESYRAIRIDGRRFLSTTPIGVAHLMAAAGRDSTYQFFQERQGDRPDTLLMPTDVVALADGDDFYGIPTATFATASPAAFPAYTEYIGRALLEAVGVLSPPNPHGATP